MALLAVPWEATGSRLILTLSAVAAATIAWTALHDFSARLRVLAACAAVAFVALEPVAVAHVPNAVVRPAPAAAVFLATGVDPALASGAHGVALRARPRRVEASWRTFAEKTPEWAGLAALFAALGAAASRRRNAAPASVRHERERGGDRALAGMNGRSRVDDVGADGVVAFDGDVQRRRGP